MLGDFFKSPYHPNLNIFPPDNHPFPHRKATSLSRPLLTLFSWEAIRGLKILEAQRNGFHPPNWISHPVTYCATPFTSVLSLFMSPHAKNKQTNPKKHQTNKQPTNQLTNQTNKTKQNKTKKRPPTLFGSTFHSFHPTPNPNLPNPTFSRVKL